MATHSGDQINALPDKLFVGTCREVDGEGDRGTDHTLQPRGLSWPHLEHLSRNKGAWRDFVSGLRSEIE